MANPSLPCPPAEAEVLAGRWVDLERLDVARHGAGLWATVGSDASLWEGVPSGPFADATAFERWLIERAGRTDQALYAIVDKAAGAPVGLFFLLRIAAEAGTAELGLVYGRALSRRVGGTEGFRLIASYVFEALGYRRLEWRCSPDNAASVNAAARFGFVFEGLLRQTYWAKGRNWDTRVCAILDREWPAIAARLHGWLDPANFDPDGRQIRALADF